MKSPKKIEDKDLYSRVMDYVLSMPKTARQVRDWLRRKTFNRDLAEEVLAKLTENNLINDEECARNFVDFKHDKLGVGAIKNKLRTRGVDGKIIQNVVDDINPETQIELCVAKLAKYMYNKERTPENKNKAWRWLVGRGFAFEIIQEVLDEHWN